MPPKRKRADDAGTKPPSTRATRSSTRFSSGSKAVTETTKSTKNTAANGSTITNAMGGDGDSNDVETAPPKKKSRTTTRGKKAAKEAILDDISEKDRIKASAKQNAPPDVKTAVTTKTSGSKTEPYTPQRSLDLFRTYADSDDPKVIGPEGFEKLCSDAKIPLEGALPLILAWQLGAKEMAKISEEEWTKGMGTLKISSLAQLSLAMAELDNLLIRDLPPSKKISNDQYDRSVYSSYTKDTKGAFSKLYMFCFALAKPEQSRNIDMETSSALWSVLLVPKFPVMLEVLEFITEREGSYRATNKDLWSMMLEFCRTIKPNLQDYETDGAWPTLLDDFVAWKKAKMSGQDGGQMDE